ncbi:MAG: hypothetical protein HY042_01315 [Spirochaetia bacterium]|nr:hypothetical protein [Spirochaetia bacterium]
MQKLTFYLLFFFLAGAGAACGDMLGHGADNADQERGALLVGGLALGCNLGGQIFKAGSGVSCSPQRAGGSGTLYATVPSGNDLSMELWFTLGSGGSLDVLGGAAADTVALANGIKFGEPVTFFHGAMGSAQVASETLVPVTGALMTVCVEFHETDSPILIIADDTPCTPKNVTEATSHTTGIVGTASGRNWGFVLNSATIWKLSINPSPVFSE